MTLESLNKQIEIWRQKVELCVYIENPKRRKKIRYKLNQLLKERDRMWTVSLSYPHMAVNTIDSCKAIPVAPMAQAKKKNKPQEKKMFHRDEDCYGESMSTLTPAEKQANYFIDRVYQEADVKREQLRKDFGLLDDERPLTAQEFVDRITSGKFTLDVATKDKEVYEPAGYIRWRDPALKEDFEGFNTAGAKLREASQNATDKIMANSADGLKALEDFKSATFH